MSVFHRTGLHRTGAGRLLLAGLAAATLAGCSGNFAQENDPTAPGAGPSRDRRRVEGDLLFGDELTLNALLDGSLFGESAPGDALPVNKYLWQGALETLSFLPLASTDPFTGVIATEWSATPQTPDQRFKVTVYLLRPDLEASSIKVAVFREDRNAEGLWVPQPVNPETPRKLEDAILTRARQIRIAAVEAENAG